MKFSANHGIILRVIGQDLERRGIASFDMEIRGEGVWVSVGADPSGRESPKLHGAHRFKRSGLGKSSKTRCREAKAPASQDSVAFQLHYTIEELKRLDQEARVKRRDPDRIPNAYGMSEIFRAVGIFVGHEKGRLHSLSLRHGMFTIVYDTAAGERTVDLFATPKRAGVGRKTK